MSLRVETGRSPQAGEVFVAGGTTMVDLMKLNVANPSSLIDLRAREAELSSIEETEKEVTIGALTKMAAAAAHPAIASMPAIHTSLVKAASPQIREMATLGGNLLQRTRCSYFRDVRMPCNKRAPGTGCSAIGGDETHNAVLGMSQNCVATYPGDFAVAALALDADVTVESHGVAARRRLTGLHCVPGETPEQETVLGPSDIITAIHLPKERWSGQAYVKLRDRASYAFAAASAAVAVKMQGSRVEKARIVLGGVATIPWSAAAAARTLEGTIPSPQSSFLVGEAAFDGASSSPRNAHKVELGIRAVASAVLLACKPSSP